MLWDKNKIHQMRLKWVRACAQKWKRIPNETNHFAKTVSNTSFKHTFLFQMRNSLYCPIKVNVDSKKKKNSEQSNDDKHDFSHSLDRFLCIHMIPQNIFISS